jgi:hypothetical protein
VQKWEPKPSLKRGSAIKVLSEVKTEQIREWLTNLPLAAHQIRAGVFEHYFIGLRDRQTVVAEACDDCPSGVVQHTDIQRFYPSIQSTLVLQAWQRQAEMGKLSVLPSEPARKRLGRLLRPLTCKRDLLKIKAVLGIPQTGAATPSTVTDQGLVEVPTAPLSRACPGIDHAYGHGRRCRAS